MICLRFVVMSILVFSVSSTTRADTTLKNHRKSPSKALTLSFGSTFIPIALAIPFVFQDIPESNWNEIVGGTLISAGVIFGPGIGHLYANNRKAFYKGVLLRMLAGGLLLVGISKKESIFDKNTGAEILIVTGGTVALISMIRDIARADGSARHFNNENELRSLIVYPSFQFKRNDVRINLRLRI